MTDWLNVYLQELKSYLEGQPASQSFIHSRSELFYTGMIETKLLIKCLGRHHTTPLQSMHNLASIHSSADSYIQLWQRRYIVFGFQTYKSLLRKYLKTCVVCVPNVHFNTPYFSSMDDQVSTGIPQSNMTPPLTWEHRTKNKRSWLAPYHARSILLRREGQSRGQVCQQASNQMSSPRYQVFIGQAWIGWLNQRGIRWAGSLTWDCLPLPAFLPLLMMIHLFVLSRDKVDKLYPRSCQPPSLPSPSKQTTA